MSKIGIKKSRKTKLSIDKILSPVFKDIKDDTLKIKKNIKEQLLNNDEADHQDLEQQYLFVSRKNEAKINNSNQYKQKSLFDDNPKNIKKNAEKDIKEVLDDETKNRLLLLLTNIDITSSEIASTSGDLNKELSKLVIKKKLIDIYNSNIIYSPDNIYFINSIYAHQYACSKFDEFDIKIEGETINAKGILTCCECKQKIEPGQDYHKIFYFHSKNNVTVTKFVHNKSIKGQIFTCQSFIEDLNKAINLKFGGAAEINHIINNEVIKSNKNDNRKSDNNSNTINKEKINNDDVENYSYKMPNEKFVDYNKLNPELRKYFISIHKVLVYNMLKVLELDKEKLEVLGFDVFEQLKELLESPNQNIVLPVALADKITRHNEKLMRLGYFDNCVGDEYWSIYYWEFEAASKLERAFKLPKRSLKFNPDSILPEDLATKVKLMNQKFNLATDY